MRMNESDRIKAETRAVVLKAMAHPSRIYIVDLIRLEGRHCVCELTEKIGADTSTISRHLALLKQAGILQTHKEGTTVYYSLACNCIDDFMNGLEKIMIAKHAREARNMEAVIS
ncbi:ArsR/SmtB family transcription factor [Spirochaeta dissipatitropha]